MILKRNTNILYAVTILAFIIQACNAPTAEPTIAPIQTLAAAQITEPISTQPQADLPESEAAVSRISVEEAKVALESGAAVIVDVRSTGAYEASHIPGAINIQLGEFETNPTDLKLDKDQWIITYCT